MKIADMLYDLSDIEWFDDNITGECNKAYNDVMGINEFDDEISEDAYNTHMMRRGLKVGLLNSNNKINKNF